MQINTCLAAGALSLLIGCSGTEANKTVFTDFSSSMLGDGVHPNAEGYAQMADVWYAAIDDVLR